SGHVPSEGVSPVKLIRAVFFDVVMAFTAVLLPSVSTKRSYTSHAVILAQRSMSNFNVIEASSGADTTTSSTFVRYPAACASTSFSPDEMSSTRRRSLDVYAIFRNSPGPVMFREQSSGSQVTSSPALRGSSLNLTTLARDPGAISTSFVCG